MNGILITGIGGDIAQGVATLVRESRPGVRLVGTDVHAEHAGSLVADECMIVPPAGDPAYGSAILAAVRRHRVDVVMPMTEAELPVVPGILAGAPEVRCVTPGGGVVAAGVDKLATARALQRLGIPSPWTIATDESLPVSYPCILKPRFGSGSRGVLTVEDPTEARCLAKKFPQAVFQELLPAERGEVTCAVYRTMHGEVGVLQLLRRLAGGLTGWATVIRDERVDELCATVAQALDVRGSFNIQLKLTEAGPRIFEINPRFSSTVVMRHRIGFKDVLWTLEELDGRRVTLARVPVGRTVVRVHAAALLPDRNSKERT